MSSIANIARVETTDTSFIVRHPERDGDYLYVGQSHKQATAIATAYNRGEYAEQPTAEQVADNIVNRWDNLLHARANRFRH